jgi:hypothetical protein
LESLAGLSVIHVNPIFRLRKAQRDIGSSRTIVRYRPGVWAH